MPPKLEYQLTLYPDPILRKVAQPVEKFDDALREMVEAMYERMAASQGVGLAAPQVGIGRRVLVLNPTGEPGDNEVLVNVEILERTGQVVSFDEGCLSFPNIYAEIKRPDHCRVRAVTLEGEPFEREYEGFPSRIVQHEYDHLEGVLLVDRMSPADKQRNKAALQALVDEYKARKAGR